jgi:TonB family protein
MRSPRFIMPDRWLLVLVFILSFVAASSGQTAALIAPNKSAFDLRVATEVRADLSETIRFQDSDMTFAAFDSAKPATPFNMSTEEAKRVGSIVGTDLLILVRSGAQRRAAIGRADYYEAFVVLYFISSRTGRLVLWQMLSKEGETESTAQDDLLRTMPPLIIDPVRTARSSVGKEATDPVFSAIEEVPAEGTPAAKDFRSPVPYRRLKPEYTRTAYLYDVEATVEATVDLDEKGSITNAAITRWAGYGLDESVLAVIRSMNWRPAERAGRPLPIRFLLRYNFKKLEKDAPVDE